MWFQLTVSSVCLYGCGMVPGWLILRRLDTERAPEQRMRALTLAAVVSVAVAALLVGSFAGTAVNYLITLVTGREQSNPVEAIATGVPLWVLTLYTVILAPVAEELFFRRVLIDRLRRYGDKPAILCAAVIFGLAHGNFSQFFYAYLLGLIFGGMYCATGRLRYSIGLHMAINFFGSVYTTLLTRRVGGGVHPGGADCRSGGTAHVPRTAGGLRAGDSDVRPVASADHPKVSPAEAPHRLHRPAVGRHRPPQPRRVARLRRLRRAFPAVT